MRTANQPCNPHANHEHAGRAPLVTKSDVAINQQRPSSLDTQTKDRRADWVNQAEPILTEPIPRTVRISMEPMSTEPILFSIPTEPIPTEPIPMELNSTGLNRTELLITNDIPMRPLQEREAPLSLPPSRLARLAAVVEGMSTPTRAAIEALVPRDSNVHLLPTKKPGRSDISISKRSGDEYLTSMKLDHRTAPSQHRRRPQTRSRRDWHLDGQDVRDFFMYEADTIESNNWCMATGVEHCRSPPPLEIDFAALGSALQRGAKTTERRGAKTTRGSVRTALIELTPFAMRTRRAPPPLIRQQGFSGSKDHEPCAVMCKLDFSAEQLPPEPLQEARGVATCMQRDRDAGVFDALDSLLNRDGGAPDALDSLLALWLGRNWEGIGAKVKNNEPRKGGLCACVALLNAEVPPQSMGAQFLRQLGESVTCYKGRTTAMFFDAVLDFFEAHADVPHSDIRLFFVDGKGTRMYHLKRLRDLLCIMGGEKGFYNDEDGLERYLAERRARSVDERGAPLFHPQDSIFVAVSAVFLQSYVAVLDSSTAAPSFVVVRTTTCVPRTRSVQVTRVCSRSVHRRLMALQGAWRSRSRKSPAQ